MSSCRPLLGVVCGSALEAAPLDPWRDAGEVLVAVTDGRPGQAGEAGRRLAAEGCRLLVSWGLASGLDPALRPGDLVIPAEVRDEAGRRFALDRRLAPPGVGRPLDSASGKPPCLLDVSRPVVSARRKAELRAATGAALVDAGTLELARAGAMLGCRVLSVRSIADPAGRDLALLAAMALDGSGSPRPVLTLLRLLRRPGRIGRLLGAWRDGRAALATLAWAGEHLVPPILRAVASELRRPDG